jgi:hypothetical protein
MTKGEYVRAAEHIRSADIVLGALRRDVLIQTMRESQGADAQ